MEIIDMAALNAFWLYIKKFLEWKKNDGSKRKFIRELAIELVIDNVHVCQQSARTLHKHQRYAFYLFSQVIKKKKIPITQPQIWYKYENLVIVNFFQEKLT